MTRARAVVFGKLPRHGDFVARGLDAPARDAWDAWLSGAVQAARAELGEGFAAGHEAASPWRFIGGPGPFGPGWRAGALAASVDSAGRRFAIMVAADDLDEGQAGSLGEALSAAAEAMIYRAFQDGWTADDLASAIQSEIEALDPRGEALAPARRPTSERWWTVDAEGQAPLALDHPPQRLFSAASPVAADAAP